MRLRSWLRGAGDCVEALAKPAPGGPIPSSHGVLGTAPRLLTPVVTAYRKRLHRFGPTARGVFWRDEASSRLRFEVLARIIDERDHAGEAVVNDLGCGYGAMFDVLRTHPALRGGRYYGYDMCTEMVEACQRRIRDPRATFIRHVRATVLADYSFASGTFNLKLDAPSRPWNGYVKASLELLWEMSRTGLAFNMLDLRHRRGDNGLYYADAGEFLDFCRTRLSDDTELIEDYGLPDWTMLVRR